MITAADILKDPEAFRELPGRTMIILDESFLGGFDKLERAMNILAESGWSPRAMAIHGILFGFLGQTCHVIMEKKG